MLGSHLKFDGAIPKSWFGCLTLGSDNSSRYMVYPRDLVDVRSRIATVVIAARVPASSYIQTRSVMRFFRCKKNGRGSLTGDPTAKMRRLWHFIIPNKMRRGSACLFSIRSCVSTVLP